MMLEKVKTALRIKSTAFDEDISDLIDAAFADLTMVGVITGDGTDPLIRRAVITYCRANFGQPDDYDRMKRSYDEQKAQLMTATGYTDWSGEHGQIQDTDPCVAAI